MVGYIKYLVGELYLCATIIFIHVFISLATALISSCYMYFRTIDRHIGQSAV